MSYNPLSNNDNNQDPFSDQNILSIEEPAAIHATELLISTQHHQREHQHGREPSNFNDDLKANTSKNFKHSEFGSSLLEHAEEEDDDDDYDRFDPIQFKHSGDDDDDLERSSTDSFTDEFGNHYAIDFNNKAYTLKLTFKGNRLVYFTSAFVSLFVSLFGYEQGVCSGILAFDTFNGFLIPQVQQ